MGAGSAGGGERSRSGGLAAIAGEIRDWRTVPVPTARRIVWRDPGGILRPVSESWEGSSGTRKLLIAEGVAIVWIGIERPAGGTGGADVSTRRHDAHLVLGSTT